MKKTKLYDLAKSEPEEFIPKWVSESLSEDLAKETESIASYKKAESAYSSIENIKSEHPIAKRTEIKTKIEFLKVKESSITQARGAVDSMFNLVDIRVQITSGKSGCVEENAYYKKIRDETADRYVVYDKQLKEIVRKILKLKDELSEAELVVMLQGEQAGATLVSTIGVPEGFSKKLEDVPKTGETAEIVSDE